jgi:phosphotransferase system HPr-like phosphotransfer protein
VNKLLSEAMKIDIGLTSQSLNGAGTGPYYSMKNYGKALFVVELGAMAAGVTSALQVMQAQNAAGDGAKVVTNNAATITANTKVAGMTITCATVIATDEVTINGLTFVADAAEDLPNRKFAVGANDTACAASLVKAINDATVGVPGVTATSALGVVTLTVDDPGEVTLTASSPDATITVATLRAIGYVECDASYLDNVNGFTHIALRVTNSAATQTGAVLLRGQGRLSPVQYVAAAKTNVNP